jgi:PEP-CTERM motif
MSTKPLAVLTGVALGLLAEFASAAPIHLAVPILYDNVGVGTPSGQTFTAEATTFVGVSFYIGDPTRPGLSSVNALTGAADLVLFDASVPGSLSEVVRFQVQGPTGSTFGLATFLLSSAVPTVVGAKYFAAIDAPDAFGLGLRDPNNSTYSGGSEAFLISGSLFEHPQARDTSFEVITSAVPEPSTYLLVLLALGLAAYAHKSQRKLVKLGARDA